MKVTILLDGGRCPKSITGTIIACAGAAEKKAADWVVLTERPPEEFKARGKPQVCGAGWGDLSIRTLKTSWDSPVQLALALAKRLRADKVVIPGLDESDEKSIITMEARALWPGKSPLI